MKAILKHKRFKDHFSTIMGAVVAIANAWMTIDWDTFDIQKEWPKLTLSALIALGGWMTQLKLKDGQGENKSDNQVG